MNEFLELIRSNGAWAYAILFGFCALKAGVLPFLAGVAAAAGALNVWSVAIAAGLGTYLGDEIRFAAARAYGERFLAGRPRLERLAAEARVLFDRHGIAYVFVYRFLKGFRTIGALPLGLTDMPWRRFTGLNAASALVWCAVMVGGGYASGPGLIALVVGRLGTASGVAAVAMLLLASLWFWRRRQLV